MDGFQTNLVVDWYLELESRLSEVMNTIPYSNETMQIFLPPLANIIVDCGSLVDTVFRKCYSGTSPQNKLNISHYFQDYEHRLRLSSLRTLLFRTPLLYVQPFENWIDHTTGEYQPFQWWKDYNSLKHDRIQEYACATLSNAVNSLGALHQIISQLEVFKHALIRHDLICFGGWAHKHALNMIYQRENTEVTVIVETELFGTPVGCERFPSDPSQIFPPRFAGGKKLWRFVGSSF